MLFFLFKLQQLREHDLYKNNFLYNEKAIR